MRNFIYYSILIFAVLGCKQQHNIALNFLDEYIVSDTAHINKDKIGGLSGIDFENGSYYFVVDDSKKPRFLKAKIEIKNTTIHSVKFNNVVYLNDSTENFYRENVLDLESIFVNEAKNEVNFVSEGSIKNNKKPTIFKTNLEGKFIESFELPASFNKIKSMKDNATFEGSSKSFTKKGFWVAMESPLKFDGEQATFQKTSSPIRITYFDNVTKKATKQFAYQLENITKPAKGNINLNGVSAIVEYKKNHFFVVERTYQSGYGRYGNIIRIFDAVIDDDVTNVLDIKSLKKTVFIPLKKRLIFNFEGVKSKLTKGIIDNIEGITLGPILSNGNQSLLLISDNNFQLYGKQLNQLILLEMK